MLENVVLVSKKKFTLHETVFSKISGMKTQKQKSAPMQDKKMRFEDAYDIRYRYAMDMGSDRGCLRHPASIQRNVYVSLCMIGGTNERAGLYVL